MPRIASTSGTHLLFMSGYAPFLRVIAAAGFCLSSILLDKGWYIGTKSAIKKLRYYQLEEL